MVCIIIISLIRAFEKWQPTMELLKFMISVEQLILIDSNEAKCLIIQKCNFTLRSPKYIINDTDMHKTCATYLPKPQTSQCSRKEAWKLLSKKICKNTHHIDVFNLFKYFMSNHSDHNNK